MNAKIFIYVLISIAVIGYFCSAVLTVKKRRLAFCFGVFAWVANVGALATFWYINGYPPFANISQVLTVLSSTFLPVFLFIYYADKNLGWLRCYFLVGAALPLIGVGVMDMQVHWPLVPALQSIWFVPHVFSYMLGYALSTVAFVVSLSLLTKPKNNMKVEKAVYMIVKLAFPFMIIGMSLGAIWAEEVWGGYWSWDIKEIWSLITIMLYGLYFHIRLVKTMKRYSNVVVFLAYVALIITFIGLNYFPRSGSLHLY